MHASRVLRQQRVLALPPKQSVPVVTYLDVQDVVVAHPLLSKLSFAADHALS